MERLLSRIFPRRSHRCETQTHGERTQVARLSNELGSYCDRDYAVLYLGHCVLSYVQQTISIASLLRSRKLH